MNEPFNTYFKEVDEQLATGNAGEHAYRSALKELFNNLTPDITVVNEPLLLEDISPDFLIKQGDIDVANVEAKDLDKNLSSDRFQDQFERYKESSRKLCITNGLEFRFFEDGEKYETVVIGEFKDGEVHRAPQMFTQLKRVWRDFASTEPDTISSARKLSRILGGQARQLRYGIKKMLENDGDTMIHDQMELFKEDLISDLDKERFADLYAQTVTYGLFAARYSDDSPEDFSLMEAYKLLPDTNPFLQKFFQHTAANDLDKRAKRNIEKIVGTFKAAKVEEIMEAEFESQKKDPIFHFYETFLGEYDPAMREELGVYYTPRSVVSYITRSVDQILTDTFNLDGGLASTAKNEDGEHRLHILDPACGTGTFLNEVIAQIHDTVTEQSGGWQQYVPDHLLPRLHGFELLMAPYTISHLKLGATLSELGYEPTDEDRLGVYLTDSLERGRDEIERRKAAGWLTNEAEGASEVKRDLPIKVVLGNPPYEVAGGVDHEWIERLVDDYKKDLDERNIQPLSDLYIKFVRLAENYIEKNEAGIVAYITNNSYLDGLIHRRMREHLGKTFDDIYVLNLHGNTRRSEETPDGEADANVFNIMQGVSIVFFVKTEDSTEEFADLHYKDVYASNKDEKYNWLNEHSWKNTDWKQLEGVTKETCLGTPRYFVPTDSAGIDDYCEGVSLDELFEESTSGIKTHRDKFVINMDKDELLRRIKQFADLSIEDEEIATAYNLNDNRDWTMSEARKAIAKENDLEKFIKPILYRPFDIRWIFYHPEAIDYGREKLMQHMFNGENYLINSTRKINTDHGFHHASLTNTLSDIHSVSDQSYTFPLYFYERDGGRSTNISKGVIDKIAAKLDLEFASDNEDLNSEDDVLVSLNILDYIYAVLHSPHYRKKYEEFLKKSFPRIQFTDDVDLFWQLVDLGSRLRKLHLLDKDMLPESDIRFENIGDSDVPVKTRKMKFEDNKIYVNAAQYFENVPKEAWEFWVGGYQPAQKWLKDRKDRNLDFDEIEHYRKMLIAISETDKLMQKIDKLTQDF